MAWTAPRTWVTGEVVTAALMNTHVRDDLRYLKGLDGGVTVEDALTVDSLITSGNVDGVDVSTHAAGDAYAQHGNNIGNHTHQSSGAQGNTLDHGLALTGLTDDDHTNYALRTILTTRGDIVYRNATVWARLAKGTAGQVLTQGANDPTWAGQNTIVFSTAGLFNGTSPISETNLDLSGTVGSNQAVCLIKVFNNSGDATTQLYAFRKDDDGGTFAFGVSNSSGAVPDQSACYLVIVTNSAGVVEWKSNAAKTTVITMEAYLK